MSWRAWRISSSSRGPGRPPRPCPRPSEARSCMAFPWASPPPGFASVCGRDCRSAASSRTRSAKPSITQGFIFSAPFPTMRAMDAKKLAQLCRKLADNKKAEDIQVLDVRKVSSVTDYFVLASGTSEPHLRAIADEITDGLQREAEVKPRVVD